MTTSSFIATPRRRPAPSPRNLQIYLDYQVEGLTQTQLAEKYNLTQCRISQILRRIDSWRAQSAIPNSESPSHSLNPSPPLSPTDLDLQLQSARLNLVAREAVRHFQQPQATVTHKQGTRGDKSIDETTTKSLPKNLQCLKIILQANNQQQRLSRASSSSPSLPVPLSPPPQASQPSESEHNISRDEVTSWLADQHRQAEKDKKVIFYGNSPALVSDLLKALLGEPNNGLALRLLAAFDGKKVANYSPRDENWPDVPPYNGWYYAMYDAHGTVVAYLHADQVAHLLPPDYPPTLAKSGGLPRSACPPLKILPLATIESSPTTPIATPSPTHASPPHPSPTHSASTSSTSASSTKFTQPQSPPPLTPHLPPITIFPPLLPA